MGSGQDDGAECAATSPHGKENQPAVAYFTRRASLGAMRNWLCVPVLLMLAGCSLWNRPEPEVDTARGGLSGLGLPSLPGGGEGRPLREEGIPDKMRDDVGTVLDPNQIVFTDMDAEDPDHLPGELKELFEGAPQSEGPWRRSYTNTFKEARVTGKPVLIWFADSVNSPNSKALGEELFSRRDFEEWAQEHIIRLELDQNVKGDRSEAAAKSDYIQNLKKRYKVLGSPVLLVLTPSGKVIGTYRGYKRGNHAFKWAQIKQATELAKADYASWREGLEKKGYREWSNPAGKRMLAKLVSYQNGELILVEPDGTRAKTKERHLSQGDQDWIAAEKAKRGIKE